MGGGAGRQVGVGRLPWLLCIPLCAHSHMRAGCTSAATRPSSGRPSRCWLSCWVGARAHGGAPACSSASWGIMAWQQSRQRALPRRHALQWPQAACARPRPRVRTNARAHARTHAGGQVTSEFSRHNSHLLVAHAAGKKYAVSVKWGVPAVRACLCLGSAYGRPMRAPPAHIRPADRMHCCHSQHPAAASSPWAARPTR